MSSGYSYTNEEQIRRQFHEKVVDRLLFVVQWQHGADCQKLQSVAGGDLLKIDTAVPYSGSYDDVVDQGQREVNQGYEPELKPLNVNPADYDVIAVGTPTWWYTMAPAVKTFLHKNTFAGKTVVPFMTNGGWPGHVIRDMKNACTGAKIACEMQVKFDSNGGDHLETPEANIDAWARDVKALL